MRRRRKYFVDVEIRINEEAEKAVSRFTADTTYVEAYRAGYLRALTLVNDKLNKPPVFSDDVNTEGRV